MPTTKQQFNPIGVDLGYGGNQAQTAIYSDKPQGPQKVESRRLGVSSDLRGIKTLFPHPHTVSCFFPSTTAQLNKPHIKSL